jgi:molybdopterin molybdotransferase
MAADPQQSFVLPFAQARHVVEEHARKMHGEQRPASEAIPLLQAVGRVLAEPVLADRDFPPFPRVTRDGYALRAADVATVPATLKVIGEIKAGGTLGPEAVLAARTAAPGIAQLQAGQAAAIMTGAAVPEGSDAVVMVEYTSRTGDQVTVQRSVNSGENIVPTASEARRGDVLLQPGQRLDYAGMALAASVGKQEVRVRRKPRVAILSTGDEIVPLGETPGPMQIRNSNSYSLAAQVGQAGAEAEILPIAPDEPVRLRELIEVGLQADLLLLAGGVSMGKYDLVEQILAELRAEFFFTGALIQPGRPIVFGRVRDKYFFGLPGNPVSTMVTFELFVRPMIDALSGAAISRLLFLQARLKSEVKIKTGLTRFLPAVLSGEFENTRVELARWQGSGDIAALAKANCYLVAPPDRERIPAGEMVSVLLR